MSPTKAWFHDLDDDLYAEAMNGRMTADEALAAHEARRAERAEEIAADTLDAHGTDYRVDGWWCDCGHRYGVSPMELPHMIERHHMIAAALAALNEKEK